MPDESMSDEFSFAHGGAVAHLETMASVARDAAEEARDGTDRAQAHRLARLAQQVEALQLLVELLDSSALEGADAPA